MRSTDLAISFFTFLTVLADVASVGIVALAVAGRFAARGRGRPDGRLAHLWAPVKAELVGGGVGLAWLVAAVSMSGSLWFSEVAGFLPCRLCWIQRACMYPLVLVLAVAMFRPGRRVSARARQLAMALSAVGAAVATYHVALERFPSLETGACDPSVPCTLVWFERLGFVTLPFMALSGFVLIFTLLVASSPSRKESFS